jgi:Ca2+-transporting ATPase
MRDSDVTVARHSSGPRIYAVQGLLGKDGLARWLDEWFRNEAGLDIAASARTGRVRIRAPSPPARTRFEAQLAAALSDFEPLTPSGQIVARPVHRAPPAQRRPSVTRRKLASGFGRPTVSAPAAHEVLRSARYSDAHATTLKELHRHLGSTALGLTSAEAAQRLQRNGPNRIADITGRTDLQILLDQFTSLPVALLGGSGVAALAMRAFGDATAIAAVLGVNGVIGYATERKAERTVAGLRKLAPGTATVLRDGAERVVATHEIVTGDVLVLKPGQAVAADARVIDAHRLSVNEAPLTGESLPVRKGPSDDVPDRAPLAERPNMVHMGTIVSGGMGQAIVTAVGEATALGAIRTLAQEAEAPRTRLQIELDGLGKRLAIGATALCAGVVVAGLLRGRAAGPLLRSAVALGVAAIPEGLPAVATSLLASGIRSMQKRNVFARSLDAIENLGAVDTVCLDKTGTLTENRMHVASLVVGTARDLRLERDTGRRSLPAPRDALLVCALCNEVERNGDGWQGSATELALIHLAEERAVDPLAARRTRPQIAMKQRSEHHPYMVTLHREPGGGALVAVKGRPQEVLARCTQWFDGRRVVPLTATARRQLLRLNDDLASRGHRVLALACQRQRTRTLGQTGRLTWLGMVGLADRVRPNVARTIERFRAAGIEPKMLTGDQLGTAQAVARQIGLDGERSVVDAGALPERAAELGERAEDAVGFARTTPAMKLELVRALQERGHVVAMTGDGINDGPAMKKADVGVAMGATGTDFAHAMSDLVLQGDHPDDLLQAIAEGRTAYLNVKKAVKYLVATNLSELALTGTCAVLGLPDPLDPLALLWTNLITDVSPAIALGLEPAEPDVLRRPPFRRVGGLLERSDWRRVAVDGGLMTAASLASFLYGLSRYGASPQARTIAFMTLTGSQLAYALTARSDSRIMDPRIRSNRLLTGVTIGSLALQAGTVLLPPLRGILRTAPLTPVDWLVVTGAAAAPAIVREFSKPPVAPARAASGTVARR